MGDKKQSVQTIKNHAVTGSAIDWDGTTVDITLDGDRPVIALDINLSDNATVTFGSVIDGTLHSVLITDKSAALSITGLAATPFHGFFTELAGIRILRITASASQTNATVTVSQV